MILPTTVGSPRRPTTNSPAMAWTPRSTREKPVGALWKMSLPRTPGYRLYEWDGDVFLGYTTPGQPAGPLSFLVQLESTPH